MQLSVIFALIAVAASASGSVLPSNMAELQEMLSVINDPNADPITVAALKAILEGYLGHYLTPDIGSPVVPSPVVVDPTPGPGPVLGPGFEIINPVPGPVPILGPGFEIINPVPGPAPILGPGFEIINPVPEPELVVVPAPPPVDQPAPVTSSAPLVQLIVNINQAN